jgi:acyl carrier protein
MTTKTPEQVREAVLEVLSTIAPELDRATLDADGPLREQIDLDSFDFLNVLIALKERLGIEVPEKDYAEVQTLNGMVSYFARTPAIQVNR